MYFHFEKNVARFACNVVTWDFLWVNFKHSGAVMYYTYVSKSRIRKYGLPEGGSISPPEWAKSPNHLQ